MFRSAQDLSRKRARGARRICGDTTPGVVIYDSMVNHRLDEDDLRTSETCNGSQKFVHRQQLLKSVHTYPFYCTVTAESQ